MINRKGHAKIWNQVMLIFKGWKCVVALLWCMCYAEIKPFSVEKYEETACKEILSKSVEQS